MSTLSSTGVFSWGPQSAKGTPATTWYRHRIIQGSIGTAQQVQQLPPEVGGTYHPTGAYKDGAFGAGTVTMMPRLEDVIGHLFEAAVGVHSVTADCPEAGVNRHVFTSPADAVDMPWLGIRAYVPVGSGFTAVGEQVNDAHITRMRLIVAAHQLLGANFDFAGCEPLPNQTVAGWTYDNTYEDETSIPLAAVTGNTLTLGSDVFKAVNASIDLINAYSTPQDEAVINSPYPDDMVLLQQTLQFSWTYKWNDPALYASIYANGGAAWSPVVHKTSLNLVIQSPDNITGQTAPYRIELYAPSVSWGAAGPPTLAGGRMIMQQFVGTVQFVDGSDYFQLLLDNQAATY